MLDDIKKKLEKLEEKETWVRQGFDEFIIELEIARFEGQLEGEVTLYQELDKYEELEPQRKDLVGFGWGVYRGEIVPVICHKEDYKGWVPAKRLVAEDFAIKSIKLLVDELPGFIGELESKLNKKNEDAQETGEKLESLLGRLRE